MMRLCDRYREPVEGQVHLWRLHPITNLKGLVVRWIAVCERCGDVGFPCSAS